MLLDNFWHIKNRQSSDFFVPKLCGFPWNFLVLPVTDSCLLPEPLIRTHSDSITPKNFCLYILQHRIPHIFLIINEKKQLRHASSAHHPTPTRLPSLGLQIIQVHLNLKIHKALGRINYMFSRILRFRARPRRTNWLRCPLWPVSSRWVDSKSNIQMPHLSSRSDIKGSPRIDKSYLLRLPCSKPIVMIKMSPLISIADLETHLHVIHATLQHLFSRHTARSSQTNNLKLPSIFFQRRKSIWQQLVIE